MKTLRLIGMALIALCITACSDDDTLQTAKEHIVSFSFKGDIEVVESPLTRTQSNDLYYIHTDIKEKDVYIPYAYGLFDNVSSMKIKLTSDKEYKFFAYIIKDGKEKIRHTNQTYSAPFYCDLNNEFIYGRPNSDFYSHSFTLSDGKNYNIPNLDFYVAANAVEYTPSENGNINIFMLRNSFGARFIAENLTEGSLKITLSNNETSLGQYNSPTINIDYPNTTVEDIFVLQPHSDDGNGDFCVNLKVSLIWVKADNSETELGAPVITFKRNKLTTITVKIDKLIENGIGFSYYDSTKLGNGGSYVVNGNNVSEEE